jgi:chromosome segregation ATPase
VSVDPILAALSRLEAGQAAIHTQVTGLSTTVAGLSTTVAGLSTLVTDLRTEMTDLRTEMTDLRTEMTDLRTEMTARMDELRLETRSSITELRVAVMDQIDRLQHTVELVKDDITVNYGMSDRVERLARAAQEETRALGGVVRAMQRQIARLKTDVDQLRGGSA